jgi:hypothetical protein
MTSDGRVPSNTGETTGWQSLYAVIWRVIGDYGVFRRWNISYRRKAIEYVRI